MNASIITIGVSSCLLGENVRYDGGHKRDQYITDTLGRFFRIVSVCPEMECGLTTPREAMNLEGDPAAPRLMTIVTRRDLTEQMLSYCRAKMPELERENLSGFIFKKKSPSCGLCKVAIYNNGASEKSARGLFAAALIRHFPALPTEESERLNDPIVCENFLARVRGYSPLAKFSGKIARSDRFDRI